MPRFRLCVLTFPSLAPCCHSHSATTAAFYATLVVRAGWNDVTNTSFLTQNSQCATVSRTFSPGELVSMECSTGPNYIISVEVGAGLGCRLRLCQTDVQHDHAVCLKLHPNDCAGPDRPPPAPPPILSCPTRGCPWRCARWPSTA